VRTLVVSLALALVTWGCGWQDWVFVVGPTVDSGSGLEAAVGPSCTRDTECPVSTQHCDPVSGQCVACVDDSQCTQTGLPRCDSALHRCVQCGSDVDCTSGEVCEPMSRECVHSCADGGVCPQNAPLCNQARGICFGCGADEDCASVAPGTVCDTSSGQCVQCTADSQCPTSSPRCDLTKDLCVGCLTNADCGGHGYCDPVKQACYMD
jgi:Cys-rich repeat protein